MNKLFSDSEEKFVNAEIFYTSSTAEEPKLYADEDCQVAAKAEEVYNAFLKGLLVVNMENLGNTIHFRPVAVVPTYSTGKLTGVEVHALACDEADSPATGYVAVASIFTA